MASRVVERLKTLIEKFSKNITIGWKNTLVFSLPSKNKKLTLASKN